MFTIKKQFGIAMLAALLAVPQLSRAQETPEERKAEQQARKQELLQKIEAVKHEKLKTALALDDETAKKFFEVYNPAEKDVQKIVMQRNEELKKLQLMMNGAKSDADVDPEVQKIRDLNQQIDARMQKLDGDLKPVLSSRQRARLLMFEHEFNQRVREQLLKRRLAKNPGELRDLRKKMRQQRMKKFLENQEGKTKP
jgi:hypothetical protein